MMAKTYIGDGVYVEIEAGMLKLSTERENGEHFIFLEAEAMDALVSYYERAKAVGLQPCPRCGNETLSSDCIDGRCGECRLHEDEAEWTDEAEGPLN